jgi:protein arginine kinase
MVEAWLDKAPLWLSGDGPESDVVLACWGCLVRDLSDFPYPTRCSDDEKRQIEQRLMGVLDTANLSPNGRYFSLLDLDAVELRFLWERQLVSSPHLHATGPRGVYVSEDQSMSIMVNENDHVRIHVLVSGLRLQDVWSRLNLVDDMLAANVNYAFDERLGFLTTDLDAAGTGLRMTAVLHLPALTVTNRLVDLSAEIHKDWHELEGYWGALSEGVGDLYTLSNRATLGRSEEEIIYHVGRLATKLMEEEQRAREALIVESRRSVEDRVWRAAGAAQNTRLMSFDDAARVLSSLRLGMATRLLDIGTRRELNQMMFDTQRAHLELRKGQACDDLTLDADRADLFRRHFQSS